MSEQLLKDLAGVLNAHNVDNDSDTPDYVLAEFVHGVLGAFALAVRDRHRAQTVVATPAAGAPPVATIEDIVQSYANWYHEHVWRGGWTNGSHVRDQLDATVAKLAHPTPPREAGAGTEETFTAWLCEQMPAGTVIGDPAWWAPKIMRAVLAFTEAAPVAPCEREALDGWWVVGKDRRTVRVSGCQSHGIAESWASYWDKEDPANAPHRVVRVAVLNDDVRTAPHPDAAARDAALIALAKLGRQALNEVVTPTMDSDIAETAKALGLAYTTCYDECDDHGVCDCSEEWNMSPLAKQGLRLLAAALRASEGEAK